MYIKQLDTYISCKLLVHECYKFSDSKKIPWLQEAVYSTVSILACGVMYLAAWCFLNFKTVELCIFIINHLSSTMLIETTNAFVKNTTIES